MDGADYCLTIIRQAPEKANDAHSALAVKTLYEG